MICTAADGRPAADHGRDPPRPPPGGRRPAPRSCAQLRADHGVRALLCEGGPRLHGELIEGGLVDELFVTHAPKLAGGVGPGLIAGLPEHERDLELAWLLAEESTGRALRPLPDRASGG